MESIQVESHPFIYRGMRNNDEGRQKAINDRHAMILGEGAVLVHKNVIYGFMVITSIFVIHRKRNHSTHSGFNSVFLNFLKLISNSQEL